MGISAGGKGNGAHRDSHGDHNRPFRGPVTHPPTGLNRLAEDSEWNPTELRLEFSEIIILDAEVDLTIAGFATGEIDVLLDADSGDEEDELPPLNDQEPPISKPGDVWLLDEHRIACGDALDGATYVRLLGDGVAQLVVTDPPYNVRIEGHASGLGAVKHSDFQMASGEMTKERFIEFLLTALRPAAEHSADGSIHFVFMDWRHQLEILIAGQAVYGEPLNLCIWNKSNAGMGSLYRSKHEFIYVFKKGEAPHINNVELGRHGRHRTNVWDYPSQTAFNGTSKSKLGLHPTVKPVALIADAIRDCSHRGGIVLDPFGGAGTTLIAAEKTGRRARLIEIEPRYVDVTVTRWQRLTGKIAIHCEGGRPFGR